MSVEDKILKRIAPMVRRSILMNFRHEGRPEKWKPSLRAKAEGGKTLSDKLILRNSINIKKIGHTLIAGTPVTYAKIHNFGGVINKNVQVKEHQRKVKKAFGKNIEPKTITVKTHSRNMNITIPKRKFMMLQEEDIQNIIRITKEELAREFKQ